MAKELTLRDAINRCDYLVEMLGRGFIIQNVHRASDCADVNPRHSLHISLSAKVREGRKWFGYIFAEIDLPEDGERHYFCDPGADPDMPELSLYLNDVSTSLRDFWFSYKEVRNPYPNYEDLPDSCFIPALQAMLDRRGLTIEKEAPVQA